MANDKTEKATPKKRDDARKKGQVAKSADLNGAIVLMAALLLLPPGGWMLLDGAAESARNALMLLSDPSLVSERGIWTLLERIAVPAGLAVLPVAAGCAVAGLAI